MQIKPDNEKILDRIKNKFSHSSISNRICCLIAHGSSLYLSRKHKESDIDIELILSFPKKEDYNEIANIVKNIPHQIECQLRYVKEIVDEISTIRKTNYKIFMYFAYANGICLIGKNIYTDITGSLTETQIKKSILLSTHLAFKDIRKSFLSGKDLYIINKNIMRTFVGICMYLDILKYQDLGKDIFIKEEQKAFVPLIIKHFATHLTKEEENRLNSYVTIYQNKKNPMIILPLVEKVFNIFQEEIS